jgi:uncharacterized protein (TIRG00374 family)
MVSKKLREPNARYKLLLGVSVTAVLGYLAFHELDLASLRERIADIPVYPILLCLIGQVCLQLFHMLRWGTLIRKMGKVPWLRIYSLNVIGNAALYILPMRLGEFARPTIAASQTQLKFGQTSSTSVIERVMDGIIIGSLALVALFSSHGGAGIADILRSTVVWLVLVFFLFALLLVAARNSEWIQKIISFTIGQVSSRLSEILERFIRQFIDATRAFVSIQTLSLFLGLSLLIWLIDALSIYALFEILDARFPFQATFMALSLIVLGSFLPSGPGQLGVFEYSVSFGLAVFGIQLEEGLLIGAIYHSILLGTILLMGLSGFVINQFFLSEPVQASLASRSK